MKVKQLIASILLFAIATPSISSTAYASTTPSLTGGSVIAKPDSLNNTPASFDPNYKASYVVGQGYMLSPMVTSFTQTAPFKFSEDEVENRLRNEEFAKDLLTLPSIDNAFGAGGRMLSELYATKRPQGTAGNIMGQILIYDGYQPYAPGDGVGTRVQDHPRIYNPSDADAEFLKNTTALTQINSNGTMLLDYLLLSNAPAGIMGLAPTGIFHVNKKLHVGGDYKQIESLLMSDLAPEVKKVMNEALQPALEEARKNAAQSLAHMAQFGGEAVIVKDDDVRRAILIQFWSNTTLTDLVYEAMENKIIQELSTKSSPNYAELSALWIQNAIMDQSFGEDDFGIKLREQMKKIYDGKYTGKAEVEGGPYSQEDFEKDLEAIVGWALPYAIFGFASAGKLNTPEDANRAALRTWLERMRVSFQAGAPRLRESGSYSASKKLLGKGSPSANAMDVSITGFAITSTTIFHKLVPGYDYYYFVPTDTIIDRFFDLGTDKSFVSNNMFLTDPRDFVSAYENRKTDRSGWEKWKPVFEGSYKTTQEVLVEKLGATIKGNEIVPGSKTIKRVAHDDSPKQSFFRLWKFLLPTNNQTGDEKFIFTKHRYNTNAAFISSGIISGQLNAKSFDALTIAGTEKLGSMGSSAVSGLNVVVMLPPNPVVSPTPTTTPPPEEDDPEFQKIELLIPIGFYKWSLYIDDADVDGETISVDHNPRKETIKHKIAYRTQDLVLWEEYVLGRPQRPPRHEGEDEARRDAMEKWFTPDKDNSDMLPATEPGMVFSGVPAPPRIYMRIERLGTSAGTAPYESFGTTAPTNVDVSPKYVTTVPSPGGYHEIENNSTYVRRLETPADVLALFAEENPDPSKAANSASMLNPAAWVHNVTAKLEDNTMLNTVLGNPDKDAKGTWRQTYHYRVKTTLTFWSRGTMVPYYTTEQLYAGYYPDYSTWWEHETPVLTPLTLCFPYENEENELGWHVIEKDKSVAFAREGGKTPEGIHRYTDVEGWSEVKEGVPKGEIWEAMAGVPSTEKLYYAVGGNTFCVEMIVQENEVIMPRTYRTYSWSNPSSTCQHNPHVECGPGNIGYQCHGKTGHGTCGFPIPGDPPSSCSTSHPAPLHSICNTHINPGYRHTWQGFFDNGRYVKILSLNVWKLEKGWVEGMEKLLVETNKTSTGTELQTGHKYITEMEVNSYNTPQPSLFWNIPQRDTSAEGRIYYSFEPQMFDSVVYLGLEDTECQSSCSEHPYEEYPLNTEWLGNRNEIADFQAMQSAKTDITVLSDTAILRTPTGDIALLYYENTSLRNIPVAWKHSVIEDQTHTECHPREWYYPRGMATDRPESLWKMQDKTMAEMWVGNRWSMHNVALKSKSYVDTGSYNGDVMSTSIDNQEPKWHDLSPTNNIDMDTQTMFGRGQQIGTTIHTGIMKARTVKTGPGWCTDAPGSVLESGLIDRIDKVGVASASVFNRQTGTNQTYIPTYGRHYEAKPDPNYILFHDAYEIHIRKNNGVYDTGKSWGMWRTLLNYEGNKAQYPVSATTKKFANMPGFERELPINDVIIYNPVSTEYSFVYTLPEERDQRLTDSSKVIKSYVDFDHYKSEYRPTDDYPVIQIGDKTYKQATFLNLDWGAQWYFPNYGDFDGHLTRRYGLEQMTDLPGQNYVDMMDFTDWLQRKWVVANFDFIYNGVGYVAGEDCELFNRGRDYYIHTDNFGEMYKENYRMYIPLENFEMNNGWFSMFVTAVNAHNFEEVINPLDQNRNYVHDRRPRAAYDGAVKHWPLDLVGRIGNLTAEHVTDQSFAPTFKQAETPLQWVINNLIPKINLGKAFRYYGVLKDVRGIPLDGQEFMYPVNDGESDQETNNYWRNTDTYGNIANRTEAGESEGSESWPITFPITSAKNIWSLRDKPYPSALRADEMKIGSEVFLDVTTLGNYGETGNLQIKPHWYFVDFDTKEWIPVDIYNFAGGKYELIYRFGLAESANFENDFDQYVTKPIYNIDWVEEQEPRNMNGSDINFINDIMQGDLDAWLAQIREDGTNVLLKELQDGVYGRENPVGTPQLILLEPRFSRTWIGRTRTLGADTNPGNAFPSEKYYKQGTLWNWKLGLPSTAYPVISENNENWDSKTVPPSKEQIAELTERDGMLIVTAEIISIGDVWDLIYEPTENVMEFKVWNDEGPDNREDQKTSEEFIPDDTRNYPPENPEPLVNTPGEWETIYAPNRIVDPNGSGHVYNPQEEHIIMTYELEKRVTDAFEAVGTH